MNWSIIYTLLAPILIPGSVAAPQNRVGIINIECHSDKAAFCIKNSGLKTTKSSISNGLEEIKIYAEKSEDQTSIITYPITCNLAPSDVIQLRGYDSYQMIDGRAYIKLIYRLHEKGDCDVTLLAPTASDLLGLSLLLSNISICRSGACEDALLTRVPRRLTALWF